MMNLLRPLVMAGFLLTPLTAQDHLTITAKVEPATATPGTEVTLVIGIQVEPGYHIYGGAAPSHPTKCLLKETEGLAAVGKPEIPKGNMPAAKGLERHWLEGAITIKQKLLVAKDAKPGALELRGAIHYMACTPELCDPPAQVEFKTSVLVTNAAATAPEETTSEERLLIAKSRWHPATVRPGEQVKLMVEVTIHPGWHAYGAKEKTGIRPELLSDDKQLQATSPTQLPDGERDGKGEEAQYVLHGKFEVSREFTVPADAKPGKLSWTGKLSYMVCNAVSCNPPDECKLSAELLIEAGAPRKANR